MSDMDLVWRGSTIEKKKSIKKELINRNNIIQYVDVHCRSRFRSN